MHARISRRHLLRIAGSSVSLPLLLAPVNAQRAWQLAAQVVPRSHGFALSVSYQIDLLDGVPLYLRVADSNGATDAYFAWERLVEPVGMLVLDIGVFGVPGGAPYELWVVTASGDRHPASPVLGIEAPAWPGLRNV